MTFQIPASVPGYVDNSLPAIAAAELNWLDQKGREVISVLDKGADASGLTDSTAAFQAAINAATGLTNGANVYVPPGAYLVSAITIPSQCMLFGCGFGVSKIYSQDATSDVITVTGASVTIKDLGFAASVTRTAGRHINFASTSSLGAVENSYFINCFRAIDIDGGGDFAITRCKIANSVAATGSPINIGTGSPPNASAPNVVHLTNVTIDNPAGSQPFAGIQIFQCGEVTLIGCEIQHSNRGLYVTPSGTQVAVSIYAIKSFFDNCSTYGVFIQPQSNTATIQRLQFTSCWASSAGISGMLIDTSTHGGTIDGISIVDLECLLNGSHGINIAGTGTVNVDILGGKFGGNTGQGILVNAGVTKFRIRCATVGAVGGVAANTGGGINVLAGASNNYCIQNNDLSSQTGNKIVDSGTGTTKFVTENNGYNPRGQTNITVGASPFTYTNNSGGMQTVAINGGTVSLVQLGTAAVSSATNTSVAVPQGQSVVVTYSVAPAMQSFGP